MSASDLPQTSRKKRIHFVWFIDSSKTKTFSVSLNKVYLLTFLSFVFVTSAVGVFFWNLDLAQKLSHAKSFVSELKEAVVQLSAAPNKTPMTLAVKQEMERVPVSDPAVVAPQQLAEKTALPTTQETIKSKPIQENGDSNKVLFTHITLESVSEASTLLKFDLQPATIPAAVPLAGWVCIIATLQDGNKTYFPEDLTETQNKNPSCRQGQFVRFSRLRPTRMYLPENKDKIVSVEFIFEEKDSRLQHVFRFVKKD